jgi:peroxiredoxin
VTAKAKNVLIGVAVIVAAVGVSTLQHHLQTSVPPTVAQHALAPDFSLPELTGDRVALSAYRGKVVLLDFWDTSCDPCREAIPRFVDLQSKYGNRGLQIIAVSMDDSPEPVRDFCRRFKINYPVVMGNANVGDLYGGILGLPIAFLIGRDGRIYTRHIGATDISVFEKEIAKQL